MDENLKPITGISIILEDSHRKIEVDQVTGYFHVFLAPGTYKFHSN